MDLQFAFDRPIDLGMPESEPPVMKKEAPRVQQSFFDWYEQEVRPPTDEAPTVEAPTADRPTVVQGGWKQLHFPWYGD
jgi:hypothetical protein